MHTQLFSLIMLTSKSKIPVLILFHAVLISISDTAVMSLYTLALVLPAYSDVIAHSYVLLVMTVAVAISVCSLL